MAGLGYTYSGIVISPAPDAALTISIDGLFYTDELINDGESSYWSSEWPNVLIKAAQHEMEVMYRNTEGARDWMNAILVDLHRVDHDIAEEHSYNIKQIEGFLLSEFS